MYPRSDKVLARYCTEMPVVLLATSLASDFLTQDGYQVGAAYKAEGGADVDTMFQVFRVTLPGIAKK